jgi:flagellar motor switch protein FliG
MAATIEKGKDFAKVAKLIVALGPEFSKDILKYLNENEVNHVIKEVMDLGEILMEERLAIIRDFTLSMVEADEKSAGGYPAAKEILLNLYDTKKADEMISFLRPDEGPFKFIEELETEKVYEAIKNEPAQIIAVIVTFTSAEKGADILSFMTKEARADIARRIGDIEKAEPDTEMINEIISILKSKLVQKKEIKINGLEKLIKILHEVDKKQLKEIIDILEKDSPEMATIIKKELFRFEDLKAVEDRYMQRILREVEGKELVLALKGVSEELKTKIFTNMSERGAEMIKDDMEATGPLKRQIVEEAQQKVLNVVRKLEASGEIVLEGGNPDVVV